MLLNYLKIAWKVLLRRKFFTFISLFGISFTLMIMLVVMAALNHVTGGHAPEKRMDHLLFVSFLRQEYRDGGNRNTPVSAHFIDRYVRTLKTPECGRNSAGSRSRSASPAARPRRSSRQRMPLRRWRVAGVPPLSQACD